MSNYDNMAYGKYGVDFEQRIDFDKLRKERLKKAQSTMQADGISGVLTFNADNIRYLTGFYVTTPNRAGEYSFVFCPAVGEPTLFTGIPEETSRRMPWLNGRIKADVGSGPSASDAGADSAVIKRQVGEVMALMAEAGISKNELIGIDGTILSGYYMEAFTREGIKTKVCKATLDKARMIKNSEEIKIMRQVAMNTEIAFASIIKAIEPGVRECDLVGIGIKALYEQGCDHTEDLVCMSGENTNPYNWTFTDKVIRPGDLIYIDVDGASYLGYKSCVYRTFCCGKATQEQKDTYAEAYGWLYDGIAACKKGNTNYDIQKAFPQSPSAWGRDSWEGMDPFCLAHGLGLTLHDRPFVTHNYVVNKSPEVPLEPGMILAVETYAGKPNQPMGVRLEEMVLVTEKGPEVLSRFPIKELMECWMPY